ncbi:hypothetical protein [Elizabethkingia anophelis]|nr:hypothetical protein [Elizabethkingia anophelis]MCT3721905.1 hypothetical protein [Elizabethkingia anophelis]MCT3725415.1 hypothetical protein [Elizabethkingia anophelis]MCT3778590.1 hypothetical protein [Elizabethkingia anophelis]MCT3785677.1 hypothetical protein [Elizabethkingia anophelis]MCT3792910.1 hypothetical protein [Elizabethkingia anophelis]
MSLLTNTQEFNTYKKRVSELLFPEKEIEDNIFRENFEYFIAFDFDYIFEEVFFEGIQIF